MAERVCMLDFIRTYCRGLCRSPVDCVGQMARQHCIHSPEQYMQN